MLQDLCISLTASSIEESFKPLQGGGDPIESDASGWYAVIYADWPPCMIYQDICRRVKQLGREYDDALYEEAYGLEDELATTLEIIYREYNQIEYLLSTEQADYIEVLLNDTVSAKVTFQISKSIATLK